MFKVDMEAIREAAIEARLMAKPANAANPASEGSQPVATLANLATLAISQHRNAQLDPVLVELLNEAMRVCDLWRDSQAARDQMRREVLETPPHLRPDLREHFLNTYPKGNPA